MTRADEKFGTRWQPVQRQGRLRLARVIGVATGPLALLTRLGERRLLPLADPSKARRSGQRTGNDWRIDGLAIDGVQYEIDLSAKNAGKMRQTPARYIDAGAKVGRVHAGPRSAPPRGRATMGVDRDQNRAIREWAQAKGIPVCERGRVRQDVVDRYHVEAGR
jgi:hypothetical protein